MDGEPAWPQPKPRRTRTQERRAERRRDRDVLKDRRDIVSKRDGYCRVPTDARWPHDGPSELAHLWEKTQAKTRNQAPEDRHDTKYLAMICRGHHIPGVDGGRIELIPLDNERLADGPLEAIVDGVSFGVT